MSQDLGAIGLLEPMEAARGEEMMILSRARAYKFISGPFSTILEAIVSVSNRAS